MGTLMPDQYGYGATEPYLLISSSFVASGMPKIYFGSSHPARKQLDIFIIPSGVKFSQLGEQGILESILQFWHRFSIPQFPPHHSFIAITYRLLYFRNKYSTFSLKWKKDVK